MRRRISGRPVLDAGIRPYSVCLIGCVLVAAAVPLILLDRARR
ncbi:hypothetical protein ABZV91_24320 [Nocardia sp. NPDC004568]